jgi:UDP-N-acetylglucosamine 2-epimerase (non-hydrolysing)
MKVLTIFGTRPEIIRLSLVMRVLDQHCEHTMVHTGQNFDTSLSDIFFRDLGVRDPDIHLGIRSESFGDQIGQILSKFEAVLKEVQPDRVLILGDTNSALSAIVAARKGIPVFHMEAGNRCYDDRVPEEVNRRIIDHSSAVLLPYTERSKENLVREGIERERIYVTGNPIKEVLDSFGQEIESSNALADLGVTPFGYFLVTIHRAENVDVESRLRSIFEALDQVSARYEKDVLVSVHPRTRSKLDDFGAAPRSERVRMLEPMGFFDFVKLEKNAQGVLTDSGTVQEECCIFRVPNVTIRDVTERPETLEAGSNIISGAEPANILASLELALSQPSEWNPPREYLVPNVSQTVSKIMLGNLSLRKHF